MDWQNARPPHPHPSQYAVAWLPRTVQSSIRRRSQACASVQPSAGPLRLCRPARRPSFPAPHPHWPPGPPGTVPRSRVQTESGPGSRPAGADPPSPRPSQPLGKPRRRSGSRWHDAQPPRAGAVPVRAPPTGKQAIYRGARLLGETRVFQARQ